MMGVTQLKSGDQLLEQSVEFFLLSVCEYRQQTHFVRDMFGDRFVDDTPAGSGKRYELAAAIGGIGSALDQLRTFKPVKAVGHTARRDHRRLVKFGRRQHIGVARSPERRENIELSGLQPRLGKQRIEMIAQHALGGIGQATEQCHRQRGQIRAFPRPLVYCKFGTIQSTYPLDYMLLDIKIHYV
jgi:hypothetical protein